MIGAHHPRQTARDRIAQRARPAQVGHTVLQQLVPGIGRNRLVDLLLPYGSAPSPLRVFSSIALRLVHNK